MSQEEVAWMKNGKLSEVKFAQEYAGEKGLVYADGAFFTNQGRITNENVLRKEIYKILSKQMDNNISRRVENIMQVLKLEAMQENFDTEKTVIHLKNGTFYLPDTFMEHHLPCRHRLPVNYRPGLDAPSYWLSFLDDLLEQQDILTLQEFMGYCLLPITKAQKMLMIIGRGGEGKSRIGVVMKAMMGEAMGMGSLAKIESSPFARADLEHLLVFVDDDLKMEALTGTNHIKSIVTAETAMDLERKGIQSYQGRLHSRFLAFGNGTLQALYDRSYGFFRRQIILTVKPRPENRVDEPFLAEMMLQQLDQIFMWCLDGLIRLIEQGFQFTLSEKTVQNTMHANMDGNSIMDFMQSSGYFLFSPGNSITSKKLYHLYCEWCDDNMVKPVSSMTFWTQIRQESGYYGLTPTKHISIGDGKEARGFTGMVAIR